MNNPLREALGIVGAKRRQTEADAESALGALPPPADLLEEARRTRYEVMRGAGGRNATARLAAANKILEAGELAQLTDEQLQAECDRLVAEIQRRRATR